MGNVNKSGISNSIKKKIAFANYLNPYVDITPVELRIGIPTVYYQGFYVQQGELIIYATPAKTFTEKNMIVGYTGKSRGVSYRYNNEATFHKGRSHGRAIYGNVRNYSKGDLIITNRRIAFIGKNDSFEFEVADISAIKIIDKTSFIIQSGCDSRNIKLDRALAGYAYGFINYVVSEYNKGVDVYSELKKEMAKITPEQIKLCDTVRQEAQKISVSTYKKIHFVVTAIFVLFLIAFVKDIINEIKEKENYVYNTYPSIESLEFYSLKELFDLPDHPHIFDNYKDAIEYCDNIKDNSTAVTPGEEQLEQDSNAPIILSFLRNDSYIWKVRIDIFQEKLSEDMDLDKAVKIIVSYLPDDFLKYYKFVCAYSYGNNDVTSYVYACRLNEEGVEYRNNVAKQYASNFYFKISHFKNKNQWYIITENLAPDGENAEWLEKYAHTWDVDISKYFEARK